MIPMGARSGRMGCPCSSPYLLAGGPGLSWQHILVAQRQVQVAEDALQDFHRALGCYMDFTGAQSHCLQ